MRLSRSRETSEGSEAEQVWGKAAAPDQELGDDIICHHNTTDVRKTWNDGELSLLSMVLARPYVSLSRLVSSPYPNDYTSLLPSLL